MKKGFTLVELLVGMLIASILMLMVGVIGTAGISSHEKLRGEADVYNDLFFGVDLIERSVRRAQNVTVDTATKTLTADGIIFKKDASDLVYFDPSNQRHVIMRNITGLNFTPSQSGALYNATLSGNVTLSGQNHKVDFNRTISVMRRNT